MPRDVNHVILTGEVCSKPSVLTQKNNKRLCIFSFKTVERFQLANGQPAHHDNVVMIEVLGARAEQYARDVIPGMRYQITGYLRVDDLDGIERIRVRAYNIQQD